MSESDNKKQNLEQNSSDNEFLCDNPISLDEVEKGLWLGKIFICSNCSYYVCAMMNE